MQIQRCPSTQPKTVRVPGQLGRQQVLKTFYLEFSGDTFLTKRSLIDNASRSRKFFFSSTSISKFSVISLGGDIHSSPYQQSYLHQVVLHNKKDMKIKVEISKWGKV